MISEEWKKGGCLILNRYETNIMNQYETLFRVYGVGKVQQNFRGQAKRFGRTTKIGHGPLQ